MRVSVGYLMTGSVLVGGAIALVEPAVNTVAYYLHEQAWLRLDRMKQPLAQTINSNIALTH